MHIPLITELCSQADNVIKLEALNSQLFHSNDPQTCAGLENQQIVSLKAASHTVSYLKFWIQDFKDLCQ